MAKDSNIVEYQVLVDTNTYIISQLQFIETKHGILTTINLVLVAFILGSVFDSTSEFSKFDKIYLLAIVIFLIVSVVCSLISFYPYTKKIGKKDNMFFFGDLSKMDNDNYIEKYILTSVRILDDLKRQNILLSKIVLFKIKKFNLAILISSIMYLMFIVYILIVLF